LILRNRLTPLWGLASLKSAGQASKLEAQGRGDIEVLSPNAVQRQNPSLFPLQSLLFRPSTDWIRPTHMQKIPSQQHLHCFLTKNLGTIVKPS